MIEQLLPYYEKQLQEFGQQSREFAQKYPKIAQRLSLNQEQIDEMAALCKKQWKTEPLVRFKLGAAVATNTGPDAIAIVYIGEQRYT